MTTIYTRILAIKKQLHLTSAEMAAKLGFSEKDYLVGIEFPSASLIEQLCSVFGVSRQYLVEGVGPMLIDCTLPVSDILAFRDERNWKQFHTPKDLSISLSLEAAELLECFQWSGSDLTAKQKQAQMEEELADILIYSVLFADTIGVDIPSIVRKKLKKNGEKYAVDKAYGSAKKYTEFTETD